MSRRWRFLVGAMPIGLVAGQAAAIEGDRWAPGAADPRWAAIAALQAYPEFRNALINWQRVATDPYPLVRAATAAAIGRSEDGSNTTLLSRLAGDGTKVVREAAVWALLQQDREEARAALVPLLESVPPPHGLGTLFWRLGLPEDFGRRNAEERHDWLQRTDLRRRKAQRVSCDGNGSLPNGFRIHLAANRAEWDGDEAVELVAVVDDPPCADATVGLGERLDWREIDEWGSVVPEAHAASGSALPILRTEDGAAEIRVPRSRGGTFHLSLAGNAGIAPGVYMLRSPYPGNPLFFRVRRTALVERDLPGLIGRAGDQQDVALRLARQRVRAVARVLLEDMRAPDTQGGQSGQIANRRTDILRQLARTEDPEAAAEVIPDLLKSQIGGYGEPWDGWSVIGGFGAIARPYAEEFIVDWQRHLERRAQPLAALIGWPAIAAGSPADRARVDLVRAVAASPNLAGWYTPRILVRALVALAESHPDVGLEVLGRLARRSDAAPYLSSMWSDTGLDVGEPVRRLLRAFWEQIRGDEGVPQEVRGGVGYRLLQIGERPDHLEEVAPGSVRQARAWLEGLKNWRGSEPRAVEEGVERFIREYEAGGGLGAKDSRPSTALRWAVGLKTSGAFEGQFRGSVRISSDGIVLAEWAGRRQGAPPCTVTLSAQELRLHAAVVLRSESAGWSRAEPTISGKFRRELELRLGEDEGKHRISWSEATLDRLTPDLKDLYDGLVAAWEVSRKTCKN